VQLVVEQAAVQLAGEQAVVVAVLGQLDYQVLGQPEGVGLGARGQVEQPGCQVGPPGLVQELQLALELPVVVPLGVVVHQGL